METTQKVLDNLERAGIARRYAIGGAVSATYLRSLNIDEPFVRQSSASEYYHTDALGSVLTLTGQTGSVQATYSYEAFGKATITGLSTNSFQYTGRESDGTGLYYYRARYYSPALQRFVSEDPIGFVGGDTNLYRYVRNNPLNQSDIWGLTTLVFDRSAGTLYVYPSNGNGYEPLAFPAGNNTTNPNGDPNTVGSNGPAPSGIFPVQPPIYTADSKDAQSYGPYFIPIGKRGPKGERLDIARQRGIGIHGGRTGPEFPTFGCIRVDNSTVQALVLINQVDPITSITIR